ncbi:MAG: thioredoxin [Deltaproteobacteria bacterium CG_4_8_14_3_um_filter_51_11]|nr:thioredoxin [bacterium]OIP41376.1 MAG: thioredoxin [Desulfobacteraceae bacterium CG2_30_51_40]PIP47335.1 MAG: thioredoxin [Deltaproteobacteria bacterium CG23_combo_of_CG06-09_8_20_14_all_51_20]PIW00743.1 MAG: thioredoxin [Deltaproteobacteria bacterium CG17_big_fil_post_rev_8_21_14_2_50_51_6]PIX18207.1 MAG: thioredoxin [Deltaproteobacteria bacterium CG_4_8_14_3_um_filter_51_11]PIY22140.1 MAG: thioredoxin [Deltaproteobacteria bacterium CG_4_10_14_3_um_filter_51_14]PJB35864.1 MAG: thioredoxin
MSEPLILHIDDSEFEKEVILAKGLVLVDFWAKWCGPCLSMAPHLDACASEYAGKARIVKLDVDDNPKTSERYAIRSIPTLIFFRDGRPIETVNGAISLGSLKERLDRHLSS